MSISESPIAKSAQPLQWLSMDWVINSNLNCVWIGWHTSARPISMARLLHQWTRKF
jgi:hypothetical protein